MRNLLIVAVLIILTAIELKAQEAVVKDENNENTYWFYVKPTLKTDETLKKEILAIKKVYGKIYTGSFDKFMTIYKKELSEAKIAIGPFSSKEIAMQANDFYSLVSKNEIDSKAIKEVLDDGITRYFYLCNPIISADTKELKFERMPAHVASSKLNEFVVALSDIRLQSLLVVGPFQNYFNAEKSKFVNRSKEAGKSVKNKFPSINSVSLTEMVEKWKLLKSEISKDTVQAEPNDLSYALQIDFPARYFDSKTLQAFVITIEYDDTSQHQIMANSFNGAEFDDNNKVVGFEKGYVWKQKIIFPNYANKKPEKIIISSMLFTDYKMLKCDDIVLSINEK